MARPTDETRIRRAYVRRLLELVKHGEPSIDPSTGRQAVDDEGKPVYRSPSASVLKEARTYLQCRGLIKTIDDEQAIASDEQMASAVRRIAEAKGDPIEPDHQDSQDHRLDEQQTAPAKASTDKPEDRRPRLDQDEAEQLRQKRDSYRAAGVVYPEEWDQDLDHFDSYHQQHEHDDKAALSAA